MHIKKKSVISLLGQYFASCIFPPGYHGGKYVPALCLVTGIELEEISKVKTARGRERVGERSR